MAKTIWFFAEGAWHQVALPGAGTVGLSLETTDGTIDILATNKLSIGTGLTLTNPSTNEAHLEADSGADLTGIFYDIANTGGSLDIDADTTIQMRANAAAGTASAFQLATSGDMKLIVDDDSDINFFLSGNGDFKIHHNGNGAFDLTHNGVGLFSIYHVAAGGMEIKDTDGGIILTSYAETSGTFNGQQYGIVLQTTPVDHGRGTLITTQGDGSPQAHSLDVNIDLSGGVGKGIYVSANTTGTPTLLVMGDTLIDTSSAGLTIGWRSFIHGTGSESQATGGVFFAQTDHDGSATGVIGTGLAANSDAFGVQATATGGVASIGVGVDSTASGAGTTAGNQYAFRGTFGAGSGGPEGYGLFLQASQVGGGTTHLHPILININGNPIFRLDPDGNIYIKTGASVHATL